jgi:hypothetical protein
MENNLPLLVTGVILVSLVSLLVLLLRSGPVELDEAEAKGPLGFSFRLKGFRKKGTKTKP